MRIKKLQLFLLLFFVFFGTAAGVQGDRETGRNKSPITKIDLGVSELTLKPGESYTFRVSYIPEDTANPFLRWYSSDERVLSIDKTAFTVTALSPGNAVVYAESIDAVSSAVCHVQVTGMVSKDAAEMHTGSEYFRLTEEETGKIGPGPFRSFSEFVLNTGFSEQSLQNAVQRVFLLAADVTPGTEKAESQKALALGMIASEPLENLNMITLQGTFEQLMKFIAGNENLTEIFGGEFTFPDQPNREKNSDPAARKSVGGHDMTGEFFTHISIAHDMGYDGEGTTIAVIDSAINSGHEQFGNRVIREKCFTSNMIEHQNSEEFKLYAVCEGGTTEADSSIPDKSVFPEIEDNDVYYSYSHGSNVAGIAAGEDGVAPKADIVGIMVFSLAEKLCDDYEGGFYTCYDIVESTPDRYLAYNYVLGLKNEGIRVDVVNMSYGDLPENFEDGFSDVCDPVKPIDSRLFKKMVEAGIIPVTSAGNHWFDDAVGHPACDSSVFSVGNLDAELYEGEPDIRFTSDQSETLVDIFAPGTDVVSASLFNMENYEVCRDCYIEMSGTSQASPMAAGALLLLKQAVPGRTVNEYEQYLLSISRLTVNRRGETVFPYTKPVLNFDGFPEFLMAHTAPAMPVDPFSPIERPGSAGILPQTGITVPKGELMPLSVRYEPVGMELQIPGLNVFSGIVTVPETEAGFAVEGLGMSAGLLEGSALPGEGVSVIVGHNTLNAEEFGPFAAIRLMDEGDRFFVRNTEGKLMTFEVYANEKIGARDAAALEKAALTYVNTLTLLTCEDELPEGGYASRRIVSAKYVGE